MTRIEQTLRDDYNEQDGNTPLMFVVRLIRDAKVEITLCLK